MTSDELKLRFRKFSGRIIKMVDKMPNTISGRAIGTQVVRSGTSPGANYRAACRAKSDKDFVNKLKIANKEARETRYWFRLLQHSKLVDVDFENALIEIESIINILTKIIKTTEQNTPE